MIGARTTFALVLIVVLAACTEAGASGPDPTPPGSTTVSTTTSAPPPATVATTMPPTTVPPTTEAPEVPTSLEIVGADFHIGGQITNAGSPAEGLLLNSRMIQAVIDIEGEDGPFVYPDTGEWDADRNTDEFIAALPSYAAAGLDAVTVGLQGGNPLDATVDNRPDFRISAYMADGSLDPAWFARLDRVLRAASTEDMVVILGLFYFGQDHRLENEAAVTSAVDGTVDWLMELDYGNVLVEICNECNVNYDHPILQPDRVDELMRRVTERSGGSLPVSASLTGGNVPSNAWINASDYILLHGNRQDAAAITAMVEQVLASPAYQADPKPIVFNEDSTDLANMEAAVGAGAGWGYHDKVGFQVPPVDWSIGSESKSAFFEAVSNLDG